MAITDVKVDEAAMGRVASPALRDAVGVFAGNIVEQFGKEFVGLTLYGPVLEAEFDERRMAAATALVLARVNLSELRRLGEQGVRLGRRGIAAPLVMTPEFIAESQDSFPLELLEIQQNHVTVTGRDCFAALELRPEHVRLQCERELKRIKMRMRQGLLAAAGREAVLGELEADIGLHLLRTLRGVLWLQGAKAYLPADEVMARCGEAVKRPLAGLRQAMRPGAERGWQAFTALYEDVEALAGMANRE